MWHRARKDSFERYDDKEILLSHNIPSVEGNSLKVFCGNTNNWKEVTVKARYKMDIFEVDELPIKWSMAMSRMLVAQTGIEEIPLIG
jgi:hypothetical protein